MLTVVMGFGRFAYTALYPYMVTEGIISLTQGSWTASANYVGYLTGVLWAVRIPLGRTHQVVLIALIGTVLCLALLYITDMSWAIIFIRLAAGVMSALGIVSVSM